MNKAGNNKENHNSNNQPSDLSAGDFLDNCGHEDSDYLDDQCQSKLER